MGFFSKKKTYRWNTPDFAYGRGYTPGLLEGMPMAGMEFGDYGRFMGATKQPNYLELLFEKEMQDLVDTDYSVFDPYSQKWNRFEEESMLNDYLRNTAQDQFGQDIAGMDDAQLKEFLQEQDWYNTENEYGAKYTKQNKLYYTPYELALGLEAGQSPGRVKGMGGKVSGNLASIHPNVGYDFWNDATFSNISQLAGLSPDIMQNVAGINWADAYGKKWSQPKADGWSSSALENPYTGFLSETNPWDSGVGYDYDPHKKTVKTSGLASILGPILSLVPGLQPVGMALTAIGGFASGNPVAGIMGMAGMIPGLSQLGMTQQGSMLAAQELGLGSSALGWGGATTGLQGMLNSAGLGSIGSGLSGIGDMYSALGPYGQSALKNSLTSYASGGDPLIGAASGLLKTGVNEYITPVISNAMQETGLSADISDAFSQYVSSLGTNAATSYLTTLDDSDSTSESTSRLVSNTSPTSSIFSYDPMPDFSQGVASGYGLPAWMSSAPQQGVKESAKGRMSNNQLDGFNSEASTQYITG